MARIASGVIARAGSGFNIHAGKALKDVRDAHRDEAMSYSIVQADDIAQPTRRKGDNWEHYTYRFTYRFNGRAFSITWRCGTLYGTPAPEDGIQAAFSDAHLIDDGFQNMVDDLGLDYETPQEQREAHRLFDACERVHDRLAVFLGEHREAWEQAVAEH